MAEETVDGAEKTAEQNTFTKEDVDKMIADAVSKSVEETSKSLNANFQKKFDEIKKEKQEVVDSKKTYEEETRGMVEQMRRESMKSNLLAKGIKAYSEAGLPVPDDEVLLDMIREDSEDPLRVVKWNIETVSKTAESSKTAAAEEYVKKHGRTVDDTKPGAWDGMTYREMVALPKDEFSKIPPAIVDKAVEASLKG